MLCLGFSAFRSDSSAVLVKDGKIVAAAQEERFTRKKRDSRFPENAIAYCLEEVGATARNLDGAFFCRRSFNEETRLSYNGLNFSGNYFSFTKDFAWCAWKTLVKTNPSLPDINKIHLLNNELCQKAAGFFASPFSDAAILATEGAFSSSKNFPAIGSAGHMENCDWHFNGSIGTFYSAITEFLGFKPNSGEYKMMGLAPYGKPLFFDDLLERVLRTEKEGSITPQTQYFNFIDGRVVVSRELLDFFGSPARKSGDEITALHKNIAASAQKVLEEIMLRRCRYLAKKSGAENLCLCGDLAQNCVANAKIAGSGMFKNIWIQPATDGASAALGAALAGYYALNERRLGLNGKKDFMESSLLGRSFNQETVEKILSSLGAVFSALDENSLIERTATAIAEGKAVGWMQGRAEFGHRALGNRSILADPRNPNMKRILNAKIKYRESFRPFAPSVLEERAKEWFDIHTPLPYMLLTAQVRGEKNIPAVTHTDGSARVQTINANDNPLYHKLLVAFEKITGCPVLVNTSFNVRGEPIVNSPEDAFRCFLGTDLDVLVVGRCFLEKKAQKIPLDSAYKEFFDPD